ncbi:MAG: class I SAM-dependent methyltransferase [Bryobacterales bacterium]|nr:class I SAM-dependent methyltransferase [Bryobacterales bacterium]
MSLPRTGISTADLAAAFRAVHTISEKPVFVDPFARVLCGWPFRLALACPPLEHALNRLAHETLAPITMSIVLRARYAEEALARAVASGLGQYVILGAGMDSFAFRSSEMLDRIEVFEIDHPVTQRKKLLRFRKERLAISPHHHFIAADLTRTSITEALAGSPFAMSRPAFLSLLGVAHYLPRKALFATARSIGQDLAPGTRLVLEHLLDEASCGRGSMALRARMLEFVHRHGEPVRASYPIDEMNELMVSAGLKVIENYRIAQLEGIYRVPFDPPQTEPLGIFAVGQFRVGVPSD